MGYQVKLTRSNGQSSRLPGIVDGPTPKPGQYIDLNIDGASIRAKVKMVAGFISEPGEPGPSDAVPTVHADEEV